MKSASYVGIAIFCFNASTSWDELAWRTQRGFRKLRGVPAHSIGVQGTILGVQAHSILGTLLGSPLCQLPHPMHLFSRTAGNAVAGGIGAEA